MATNHLFIGLGGTGKKVLRELRKRVTEEFGPKETSEYGVCLEYIYVDSSESELNDRTGWKVLGKSVHLLEGQKVSIHGINGGVLENLNQYPGIQTFLPPNEVKLITSRINNQIKDGIGGQRRRLGRLLLANNLSSTSDKWNFVSCLKQTVKRLTETSKEQMVTFHVCAGLAGGTGSGSIVDIIAQIRKIYSPVNNVPYKIYLYLYLPEANSNYDSGHGFYQANGYAALLELNAASVKKYHPYDISGEIDSDSGEVKRLLANVEPFDAAFVYSNVNENNKTLEINHDLPAAVADFLFQQTVASQLVGNGQMTRLVKCENDGAEAENDRANQTTRSRRFLSFGIKRVEYPENEIKEYATYKFAQQAARQFTFNAWDSTRGYIELTEEEVGLGFAGKIKEPEIREELKLSDPYLMLVNPLVPGNETKSWKGFRETWQYCTGVFATDVVNDEEKRSWLTTFDKKCEKHYASGFRTFGVVSFYKNQREEITRYAKLIRRHIENILFDRWVTGGNKDNNKKTMSILEISKFLSLLIKDCTERISDFEEKKVRLNEKIKAITNGVRDFYDEWARINWTFDVVTGSSRKKLDKYKGIKCDLYIAKTNIEGYNYAQELLQAIIKELSFAKEGVDMFKSNLMNILDEVGKQANSRCQDSSITDESRTIKKYDPEKVQELVKSYITTEDMQSDNARNIRNAMVNELGDNGERSFVNLCDKTDYDSIVNIILDKCSAAADAAMENSAKDGIIYKMVKVNILEKLKQELNTDEKLENFVKDLVTSASSFVQFNQAEENKRFVGNGGSTQSMVQLCIPRYEDDTTGFRDKLIRTFELTCANVDFNIQDDVAENYKQNQIVVVTARSGFPLRYLSNLTVLKQKYDQLLADKDKELNKLLLHGESFEEGFLPSLYELDNKKLKAMVIKPVLLAYAMGLIEQGQDPVTQEKFDVIDLADPEFALRGKKDMVPLGKNVLDTIDVLANDYDKAMKVVRKQKMELAQYRSNAQKAELRDKLLDVILEKVKACPECENNDYNPIYKKYQAIILDLVKNDITDR